MSVKESFSSKDTKSIGVRFSLEEGARVCATLRFHIFNMTCLYAVSYTHLDVYKRQVWFLMKTLRV